MPPRAFLSLPFSEDHLMLTKCYTLQSLWSPCLKYSLPLWHLVGAGASVASLSGDGVTLKLWCVMLSIFHLDTSRANALLWGQLQTVLLLIR
jgi:hypothetical protein